MIGERLFAIWPASGPCHAEVCYLISWLFCHACAAYSWICNLHPFSSGGFITSEFPVLQVLGVTFVQLCIKNFIDEWTYIETTLFPLPTLEFKHKFEIWNVISKVFVFHLQVAHGESLFCYSIYECLHFF